MYRFIIISIFACLICACSDQNNESYLGYIDGDYVYLSSSVGGVLKSLDVARGQSVNEGQVLYKLDPNPEQSELAKAKSQYDQQEQTLKNLIHGQRETILEEIMAQKQQAEADLSLSTLNLERYKKLSEQGAVGKIEYDQWRTNYKSDLERVKQLSAKLSEAKLGARKYQILAQASAVAASKAEIEQLDWALSQKTMFASSQGFIFDTFYRKGEYVPAGQAVLALLPPQNIYLKFYVPEEKLSSIKLGQTVSFSCDRCQKSAKATINYISSNAEYTPPVIYSRDSRQKLVYLIEASLPQSEAIQYHTGQPITVSLER